MEYDWKPTGGDWDLLREFENGIETIGKESSGEIRALIARTFAGLGFSKEEAAVFEADEPGFRRYVVEARGRIRNGSRRLGEALIAAEEFVDQGRVQEAKDQLRQFISSEPVLFYREIAENELKGLR